MEPLSTVLFPGGRSRRYILRGVALNDPASGEPLSTLHSPGAALYSTASGSRSQRHSLQEPLSAIQPSGACLGIISRQSLSMVQSPGNRSRWSSLRAIALGGPASGQSLSVVQPPGSRSRWSSLRAVALDGPVSGQSLSMVQSPGNRSRWSSLRAIALDGPASGQSLSVVQPPGNRSRWSSLRAVALGGPASGQSLSMVQPPGSRSRWSSLPLCASNQSASLLRFYTKIVLPDLPFQSVQLYQYNQCLKLNRIAFYKLIKVHSYFVN